MIGMRKIDGSLWTWGQALRNHGSLEGRLTRPTREDVQPSFPFTFAGGTMCLRQADGAVACPFFAEKDSPPFDIPPRAREISFWIDAGFYTLYRPPPSICAIAAEGELTCRMGWEDKLMQINRPPGARQISLGADHLCTIDDDQRLSCESVGPASGELKDVWAEARDEMNSLVQIVSSRLAACARSAEGKVWCWGSYGPPSLRNPLPQPTMPDLTEPATALVAGEEHFCALGNAGGVFCWGDYESRVVPGRRRAVVERISGLPRPAISLASARAAVCAVLDDTSVWCWGDNYYGQLADGEVRRSSSPLVFFRSEPRPIVACD